LVNEFEILIDGIFKRNSKMFLQSFYEEDYSSESINGTKILTLKKIKKSINSFKLYEISSTDYETLPEYLKCRESFLK